MPESEFEMLRYKCLKTIDSITDKVYNIIGLRMYSSDASSDPYDTIEINEIYRLKSLLFLLEESLSNLNKIEY